MTNVSVPSAQGFGFADRVQRRFLHRYSGRNARLYEARRQGARWDAEGAAFHRLYGQVSPRSVLDCPIGTGRWLDTYQESGASVTGLDLSADMLAEAARKIRPNRDVRLWKGDLMDSSRVSELGSGYDLIVCTRFIHWVAPPKLEILAGNLGATGSRFLLLGAMVRPKRWVESRQPAPQGWRELPKRLRRLFRPRVPEYVHDEQQMLQAFRNKGWQAADRQVVTRDRVSRYYYYLLRRDGDDPLRRPIRGNTSYDEVRR